jgi:transcriptional regulator
VKVFVPSYQRQEDPAVLWEAVERWSFANVISAGPAGGAPLATWVPFVRRDSRLWMHLAAANPHAGALQTHSTVLCLFDGPHAYVSPTWYAEDHQVPTWNYVQVTVTGEVRAASEQEARWVVEETVREHGDDPSGPMAPTTTKLLPGIRAFEVLVDRIEGRFKLSQNKSEADRVSVAERLAAQGGVPAEVASLMRRFAS